MVNPLLDDSSLVLEDDEDVDLPKRTIVKKAGTKVVDPPRFLALSRDDLPAQKQLKKRKELLSP